MNPFVSPYQDAVQKDGGLITTTEVGGLFGMDVGEELGEHEDSAEAHEARIKPSPEKPTKEEVARHDATHCPYRSWCAVCVAASAREDPHTRQGKCDTEEGLPVVQADYDLLEENLTLLIVKDKQSGAALAYDCETKGPGDAWVVKQLTSDLADWGRTNLCLMSDGEPAITALQRAVASARPEMQTLLRNSPPYNPQSNGGAEKAVQDVVGIMRRLVLALEARLRLRLDLQLPIVRWLVRHAAFVFTRYQVGHDGLTPWRRLTGRTWNGVVAEFGEQVMGKLALKKPSTDRKVKKGKRKLAERSVRGTWVGIFPRTGEHVIVLPSGEAIRVRTIHRIPVEDRWDPAAVAAVRATPRRPVPSRADTEPTPREAERNRAQGAVDGEQAQAGTAGDAERAERTTDGSKLERPQTSEQGKASRELRIDNRILEKFGYSEECPGCLHRQMEAPGHRQHSSACRRRLYELMMKDPDEIDRLNWNEARMGREAARAEEIQRSPEVLPERSANEGKGPKMKDHRGDSDPDAAAPQAATPERNLAEVVEIEGEEASKMDDIQIGQVEEYIEVGQDEDVDMEDGLPEMAMPEASDDDIGPGGPYTQDSDDEDSAEPPTKKAREELKLLMATSEVKRILKELDECPELQLPRQQKRSAGVTKWNTDCAEIYSPPRITEVASRMKMKRAWALDLTTLDEHGNPWDFSLGNQRKKALELLERDKPLLLVACPMCGPFSSINDLNYVKMNTEEIQVKLKDAMMHMRFALCLCLKQLAAGRLFMFEHPSGASSWGTKMMQEMLGKEGVFLSKFDFCQLGMEVLGADGGKVSAKKRTSVMTNSRHLAEILRQAQCSGAHRHEQLVGGKAKQCEVYPEKFAELICTALKREIADAKWRRRVTEKFEIGTVVEKLMAVQAKMELEEPPHEADGTTRLRELYANHEFVDDVSGLMLDKALATSARKVEIDFFKDRGVYKKVVKEPWMSVISTKWLDVNKGDEVTPNYRARLVGREIAWDKRDDLYAATPPLESLKAVLSVCASAQRGPQACRVMAIDVKRAYFYAPATRPLFVKIPKEDWEEGDEDKVAWLQLSLYGTRDAALNWTTTYTDFLVGMGFVKGRGCTCNFHHPRGLVMTVHGDDFTSAGSTRDLAWLKEQFESKFEITAKVLGPEAGQEREIRVLNRVLRWESAGVVYEPDQRHAEMVIREFGLEAASSVLTPGTRAERDVASAPSGIPSVILEDEPELMSAEDSTRFRGLAARCNYLAQDRADIQFACKEASRRMAKPRCEDWQLLKRIARYLAGAPRYEQLFAWQDRPTHVNVFTDSDWAGCKTTCRSTSGGAALWGKHCFKAWSSTQATVALSSAEAELYALTKGAAQGLGLMTLLADFGVAVEVTVHTDASAAIGIVRRAGLGKLRHLNVRYLWLQDQVKNEVLGLEKVAGADNPADLGTKHLNSDTMKKHLVRLGVRTSGGRAGSAPTLGVLSTRRRSHRGGESQRQSVLRRTAESWPARAEASAERLGGGEAASGGERRSGELHSMEAPAAASPADPAEAAASGGKQRWTTGKAGSSLAEEFLGKTCETEELKKRLRESSSKLRELAAKLARNG